MLFFRGVRRAWVIFPLAAFSICIIVSPSVFAFDGDVRVDDDSPAARVKPAIALDKKGNIFVVWHDEREGMWNWTVYFAKSTDGGKTFGPNVRVGSSSMWFDYAPSIAVDDSGNIYVAWYDEGWWLIGEDFDIYLAKSTDSGTSFGPRVRVDHGGTSKASRPSLAVDDSGVVYVAWDDDQGEHCCHQVYLNKSTDGGETFDTTDVRIDTDVSIGYSVVPSLELGDRRNVYVTWTYSWEDGVRIFFNKSTDGGNTFGSTHIQVDNGSRDCPYSTLAVDDSGTLYVIWFSGHIILGMDVYFNKSTDGGTSFGTDVRVNDVDSTAFWPSLAVDGKGNIFVAWQDRSRDGDIYFAMSTDWGVTFSEDIRVDHQEWVSDYPSMATDDSGNVYIVWEQTTQFNGVPDAIYFTKFNVFSTSVGPTSVEGELSTAYELVQNYPNPFNTATDIRYQIPALSRDRDGIGNSRSPVHTTLKIYNTLGQEVRGLVDEPQEAGHYSVSWDGCNDRGREVASGIYFYRLTSDSFTQTKKMLLLK